MTNRISTRAAVVTLLLFAAPAGAQGRKASRPHLVEVANRLPLGPGIDVSVSYKEITVDGRRAAPVVCTYEGRPCGSNARRNGWSLHVDPVNKEHGKRESLLIVPLQEALVKAVRTRKEQISTLPEAVRATQEASLRTVNLRLDHTVPFRVLAEAVYSTAMSEIHDVRMVVKGPKGVGALAIEMPRISTTPRTDKPLNITVLAKSNGNYRLTWKGQESGQIIPGSDPDYAALYNAMVSLRDGPAGKESGDQRIHVSADLDVKWEVIARTIDAVQCRRKHKRYSAPEDLDDAAPPPGKCTPLFPEVVFAMTE